MKCIKSIKQSKSKEVGDIIRTTNVDADIKVKTGHWVFIPKSEWKDYRGHSNNTDQETDQVKTKKRGK